MPFKCVKCGYDLTGIARTLRLGVRCPECGDTNALGVVIRCIRCHYDLSGHARSNKHLVTCPECGERDAVRLPPPAFWKTERLRRMVTWAGGIVTFYESVMIGLFSGLATGKPQLQPVWPLASLRAGVLSLAVGGVLFISVLALTRIGLDASARRGRRAINLRLALGMILVAPMFAALVAVFVAV